jgi:hypothetical protein
VERGAADIERVFREEYGRAVAVLVRYFGVINLAEEAVQEAFEVAVERWPVDDLPPSPAGCAVMFMISAGFWSMPRMCSPRMCIETGEVDVVVRVVDDVAAGRAGALGGAGG